jgi:hypothetical protein
MSSPKFVRRSSFGFIKKEEEEKKTIYDFEEKFTNKKELYETWECNEDFKNTMKIKQKSEENILVLKIENLQKYNTWYTLETKEMYKIHKKELNFEVRFSKVSGGESKFTCIGGMILRFVNNGSEVYWQKWNEGFTTIAKSTIESNKKWNDVKFVVKKDKIKIYENGKKVVDHEQENEKKSKLCFHLQHLDTDTNIRFELKNITLSDIE